jgi:hypothetical protein
MYKEAGSSRQATEEQEEAEVKKGTTSEILMEEQP